MKTRLTPILLCFPLTLAACGQGDTESDITASTQTEHNEAQSASTDETTDAPSSEDVSSTPELALGEPLHFNDSNTSGYGTVTFESIELKDTCYNVSEEKELPPLDFEGNPTEEIYLHTTIVLEGDPNSYAPSPLPDISKIDGEGFTIPGLISQECNTDERSTSAFFPEANPGEKILIEMWQEVPKDLSAIRFSGHEYSLVKD